MFDRQNIPDPLRLIEIKEELCQIFNLEVDLVCLNTASPIIGMQVLKYGKLLFANDPKKNSLFAIDLFTDYMDLKRMRKTMEDRILERKYYG